jgi:hypothetical protein
MKMMVRGIFLSILGAGISSAAIADVLQPPTSDIKVGPGNLHINASVEAAQDSNIYLSETATGSLIIKPGGGIGYSYEAKRGMIAIGYDVQGLIFSRSPDGNNALHQTGAFDAGYEFMKDGRFTVTDRFQATTDQASNELTARERRNQNNAGADVVYGGKWFVGVGVDHVFVQYLKKDMADLLGRTELTIAPRIGTMLGSKTKGYVKVGMGIVTYDNALLLRDNSTLNILVGVQGQISSKITGVTELGVFTRTYKDSSSIWVDPGTNVAANVRLKWEAPAGINVALGLSRAPVESVWGRYYVSTGLNLGMTKDFGSKFSAGIVGGLSQDAYEELPGSTQPNRTDNIIQVGVSLGYEVMKNVRLKVSDLYRSRASADYPHFDYSDNVVSGGVYAAF